MGTIDGHIEFEGIEVVDVQLGSGDDILRGRRRSQSRQRGYHGRRGDAIGGQVGSPRQDQCPGAEGAAGQPDAARQLQSEPRPWTDITLESRGPTQTGRQLASLTGVYGIVQNAYTISGMTLVHGGGGADDIRVLRTEDLPPSRTRKATSSSATTTTQVSGNDLRGRPDRHPGDDRLLRARVHRQSDRHRRGARRRADGRAAIHVSARRT